MTAPDCSVHGTLVFEYVRGNLDDAEGLRAEAASTDCPECRTWLTSQFSGPEFAEVEDAVGTALRTVDLPQQRPRFGWLAAAAAILVIAGGLTVMQFPDQSTPELMHQNEQTQSTLIGAFDFEEGSITGSAPVVEDSSTTAEARETVVDPDPLFSNGLENGEAGSWTFHT